MSAIVLHRTDSAKNMRRFYRLDVQPDLFGQWCLIREWGRIGRAGQERTIPYPTAGEAHEALAQHRRVKERRGYGDNTLWLITEADRSVTTFLLPEEY